MTLENRALAAPSEVCSRESPCSAALCTPLSRAGSGSPSSYTEVPDYRPLLVSSKVEFDCFSFSLRV